MGPDPAVAALRLAVRRALPEPREALPGGPLLVACSGGADSLALLAATVFETRRGGRRVIGAVVDHGLQDDSADHTARVVEQMAALGADETASIRVRVDVAARGLEAGAREARYGALGQLATHFGADLVLLGHTLDDQAETVLLGLTRGSGGRSIAGMRRGFHEGGPHPGVRFSRPLLDITRAQTEAACRAEGIDFWLDPHNSDPRFLRSRVRHDVLPVLERELGPGVAATLARTAEQLRPDMELLDELAHAAWEQARAGAGLSVEVLHELAVPLRTRALRLAALEAGALGGELSASHIAELDRLVTDWRGQVRVELPGHVYARRADGVLEFVAAR